MTLLANSISVPIISSSSSLQVTSTSVVESMPYSPKILKRSSNQQLSNSNNYSINNIEMYDFAFNYTYKIFTISFNSTKNNSIAYLEMNQSIIENYLSITPFDPLGRNSTFFLEYYPVSLSTYAKLSLPLYGTWKLQFNSIFDFNSDLNKTFNFQLTLFFPSSGYNFDSAIDLYDYTSGNTSINASSIVYNPLFPFEDIFFKMRVVKNRRVDLLFKDTSLNSTLLDMSSINFYQLDAIDPSSPYLLNDAPNKEATGLFNYSWVSGNFIPNDTLWINVRLNSVLTFSDGYFKNAQFIDYNLQSFSVSFSLQNSGYSRDTAIPVPLNDPIFVNQSHNDRYVQDSFFKFQILKPNGTISIHAYSSSNNSYVLGNSRFIVYYQQQSILLDDLLTPTNGSITFNLTQVRQGLYYIQYTPTLLPAKGVWVLSVAYLIETNSVQSTPTGLNFTSFSSFLLDTVLPLIVLFVIVVVGLFIGVQYREYKKNKNNSIKQSGMSFFFFLKLKFRFSIHNNKKNPNKLSEEVLILLEEIEKENKPDI